MSLIRLNHIKKTFYLDLVEVVAIKKISLSINGGELVSIVGHSGSGKTTLLHVIGCLSTPTEGEYFLDGVNVSHLNDTALSRIRNQKIGFVFQSFNLLSKTSALHNVELPLIYANVPAKERRERAYEALEEVGLKHRVDHFSTQLSGGEQQRVAIARALVSRPSIILADEPTGNLDSKSGEQILEILKEMNDKGKTVIIVTHNESIAEKTNRIIHLKDGEVVS